MASSHTVINQSVYPVWVVLDTDREVYLIQPSGSAVYVRANPFDRVSLRAYDVNNTGGRGQLLGARRLGYWSAVTANSTTRWNGSAFN